MTSYIIICLCAFMFENRLCTIASAGVIECIGLEKNNLLNFLDFYFYFKNTFTDAKEKIQPTSCQYIISIDLQRYRDCI